MRSLIYIMIMRYQNLKVRNAACGCFHVNGIHYRLCSARLDFVIPSTSDSREMVSRDRLESFRCWRCGCGFDRWRLARKRAISTNTIHLTISRDKFLFSNKILRQEMIRLHVQLRPFLKTTSCSFGLSATSQQYLSQNKPVSSTFLSEQISTSQQPNEEADSTRINKISFF
jgi:hypothetical protein